MPDPATLHARFTLLLQQVQFHALAAAGNREGDPDRYRWHLEAALDLARSQLLAWTGGMAPTPHPAGDRPATGTPEPHSAGQIVREYATLWVLQLGGHLNPWFTMKPGAPYEDAYREAGAKVEELPFRLLRHLLDRTNNHLNG